MSLDVDGILHVTAIEKETGKSKHITIARALEAKSPAEIAAARQRVEKLYSSRAAEDTSGDLAEDQADQEGEEISEPGHAEVAEEPVAPTSGIPPGRR
jgi:molecular chaperone DnaK (HSP70)